MKRVNKAKKIREYVAEHPEAKAKEIAVALKIDPQYIHQVVYKIKREAHKSLKTWVQDRPKRRLQGAVQRPEPTTDIVATHHTDMVNHPPHYKSGGIETIDFIEAKGLSYHLGNVVKYVSRADHKGNKLEDLKKAQWYLNRAIEKLI